MIFDVASRVAVPTVGFRESLPYFALQNCRLFWRRFHHFGTGFFPMTCQIRRDEPVDTGSMGAVISFGLIFLGTLGSIQRLRWSSVFNRKSAMHLKNFVTYALAGTLESSTTTTTTEMPPPAPTFHSFPFLCNPSIQSLRCQTNSLIQKRVAGTVIFCVATATHRWSCVMFYVVSRYTSKCTKNHSVNMHQSILFISAYKADPLSGSWGSSHFSSSRWDCKHDKLMSPADF